MWGLAMDAEFFVIMPAKTGWDVYHGVEGQGFCATCDEAVHAAYEMAAARVSAKKGISHRSSK